MKHLRKFDSVADLNAAIANSTIGMIGLAYNNGTPVMKKKDGGSPVPPAPDPTTPFYIEDISGSSNTLSITKSNADATTLTIEKSLDGETWESMGTTSTTAITATIPANGKLYLRCNASRWGGGNYYNHISMSGNGNAGGNIMSLLYGNNFTGNETTFPNESEYAIASLFYGNNHIINASNLLLPANTLYRYCYQDMFRNCTSLTTAPALPATTLDYGCYYCMFFGCTSLTTAPALPATTLSGRCYGCMFYGCTNLNYIKCLATNISANKCTETWVNDVAANGTFVKDPSMTSWETGVNGIPSGWTVQDATA